MLHGLLNLDRYTGLELALYASGAYLWVVAYVIYARNGRRFGVVEMPAFAACGNIGWELNWALIFTTDLGTLCVWAHRAWFCLDLLIFYFVLKHGHKQTDLPLLKKHWVSVCLIVAVCSAAFYGSFVHQGLDVGSTIQSAYICQLPISFLYIPLMLRQESLVGWSLWAAWCRSLGTGLIGIFAFLRYPNDYFLLTMAVISTAVDLVYVGLFMQKRALAPENQSRLGLTLAAQLQPRVRVQAERSDGAT
jgi:hypothetical protein